MRPTYNNILIEAGDKATQRQCRKIRLKTIIAAAAMLLAACEAPLNLEGVEAEKQKQLRRTDQLMAVATTADKVTVVGSDGLVLNSDKAKLDWQRQELEGKPNFVDIDTCANGDMIALSMEHQVWISKDQGQSWSESKLETPESLIALSCAADNSYWASGSFSTLMSSRDGGKSWTELSLNEDSTITQVQFFDTNNAIAVGEFGLVARSSDGGQNWDLLEPIPNEFFPQGAYFKNPNSGWVAGLGGIIYHTSDAGVSWQEQDTPTQSPLYGFHAEQQRLFAFGDHGTVLELKEGEWQKVKGPKIPIFFRDGKPISDTKLLVVGGWGSLFTLDI